MQIKFANRSTIDKSQFVTVNLCFDKPSAVYAEGTAITPAADGALNLYLEQGEFKLMQKAGRTIAAFGLTKVDFNTEAPLSIKDMVFFAMGLFDGRNDFEAAFNAADEDIKKAEDYVEVLTDVRRIANTSSKESTPEMLAEELIALCNRAVQKAGRGSISSIIMTRDEEGAEDFAAMFAGLSAVGAGSENTPVMASITYDPKVSSPEEIESLTPDIALVGKGITFDSGGYDLKPPKFMDSMRTDKTGAVTMAGTLALAILMGLDRVVTCYLPCSENLVSGKSMLPGDIITYSNGVSVEINNIDAEGRLILADGLIEACNDDPQLIIDAATLTGAAKVAVGRDMTAVLTPDNLLPEGLVKSFEENEEELWPLPMRPYFKRYLKSNRADIANCTNGTPGAGASTAAAFLQHFVDPNIPWVHFDLSSAYMAESSPYYASGMSTAAGVFSLAQFITSEVELPA